MISSTGRIAELIGKRKVEGRENKTENEISREEEDNFGDYRSIKGRKMNSNRFSLFY